MERGWEGGHRSEGRGRARGRAGLTAEGAAPAAVPRRALARRCQGCAPPGPPPGRSARSPARRGPDSHSQHSLGAAGGAGAGTRAPPRGAAESAWPRVTGVFEAPPPRQPPSRSTWPSSPLPDAPSRVPPSKGCQALLGLVRWLRRQGQGWYLVDGMQLSFKLSFGGGGGPRFPYPGTLLLA